jgi:hypothetical protein
MNYTENCFKIKALMPYKHLICLTNFAQKCWPSDEFLLSITVTRGEGIWTSFSSPASLTCWTSTSLRQVTTSVMSEKR